ncbi:hypothetical protein DL95DRAFT_398300 [Leptodontidium sp. 2 PMI_412]|nr:hypothetical protein DL95DRAFT_398300 [Leptodontidium sp. 2 PMI_412]
MSSPLELITTIYPAPGKTDRLIQLLAEFSGYVKANEPGTLRYHVHQETDRKVGTEEVILIETYKDKEAIAIHGQSKEFKAFAQTVAAEGLDERPPQIKFVKSVSGFHSRS